MAAATKSKSNYTLWGFMPLPFMVKGAAIYAIVNRENLKMYIGSALRLNHRITCHRSELGKGEHHSTYLQRAFNKNPDAFYVEILEELGDNPSKDYVLSREQFWMDFYRSANRHFGYNVSPTAESCQGIKQRPETIIKAANARRGRKRTDEQKARLKLARSHITGGWKWSKEARARHSQRLMGHKTSPIGIAKQRAWMLENTPEARPVNQFTKEGDFLRRFKSVTDAERFLGVKRSNISAVCKYKRPICLGFVWRYEKEK